MPSTLRLTIREGCSEPYIEFYVDGLSLRSTIDAAPGGGSFSIEECLPWWGGDYNIDQTVLGQYARTVGLKDATLFVCGCGQYGCGGAVLVDVYTDEHAITFCNFRVDTNANPIDFDRRQYNDEVADLTARVAAWKPPPPRPQTRRPPPPPTLPDLHPEPWPPT